MDWERLQRFTAWQAYGVAGMVATVYRAADDGGFHWIVCDGDGAKVADGVADDERSAMEACERLMGIE